MTTASTAVSSSIISLAFHDVTDNAQSSGFRQPVAQKYKHSLAQFEACLDAVQESGLRVTTSLEDLNSDQPSVIFTFDDGGVCSEIPAAMLEARGWRGVFFVTTDLVGTRGFMSAAQVKDLHRRGHLIGSHSCSHPDVFRSLTRAQMQYEWCNSVDFLSELLGDPCVVASVPGGDMNAMTISEAAAAGLKHVFTSEQRTAPWQQAGVTCYGRMFIMQDTQPHTVARWLRHPNLGILPERTVRMTKTAVKKMMGPVYRHIVASWRSKHEG